MRQKNNFNGVGRARGRGTAMSVLCSFLLATASAYVRADESVQLRNYPIEPVFEVARTVAQRLQPIIQDRIHVVRVFRKETSPLLAVTSAHGMCIVVLNKNPDGWAVWERFFKDLPSSQHMNMVELSVAHEIGHCVEAQTLRSQKISPDSAKPATRALTGKSELHADVFASAYARVHMKEETANATVRQLIAVRERHAWREPGHNTGATLTEMWRKLQELTVDENSPEAALGLFETIQR